MKRKPNNGAGPEPREAAGAADPGGAGERNAGDTSGQSDDVELSADFIEKLAEPLKRGRYDCSAGPLLEFFPPKGKKYLLASVLGGACVMLHG